MENPAGNHRLERSLVSARCKSRLAGWSGHWCPHSPVLYVGIQFEHHIDILVECDEGDACLAAVDAQNANDRYNIVKRQTEVALFDAARSVDDEDDVNLIGTICKRTTYSIMQTCVHAFTVKTNTKCVFN